MQSTWAAPTAIVRCLLRQRRWASSSSSSFAAGTINGHNSPSAAVPLLEHYRPRWPLPAFAPEPTTSPLDGIVPTLRVPKQRSIPASVLRFSMQATFSHGSSIFYKHLAYHPADYKVSLKVTCGLDGGRPSNRCGVDRLGSSTPRDFFCFRHCRASFVISWPVRATPPLSNTLTIPWHAPVVLFFSF